MSLQRLHAQWVCPVESSGPAVTYPANATPCFFADDIFNNCTPVYLNVNVHFFVNDDCSGNVQKFEKIPVSQANCFAGAESMINNANANLAANPEQWPRQDPSVIVCNPIKYVLKGVYIHCKTNTGESNFALMDTFAVNKSQTPLVVTHPVALGIFKTTIL